jgi:(p)ppGpp synthase/HD superfamily hydrolase
MRTDINTLDILKLADNPDFEDRMISIIRNLHSDERTVIAFKKASNIHTNTNHRYGEYPYSVHLALVGYVGLSMNNSLPTYVYESLFTHDVIEDCRLSYNDVSRMFGTEVAEITYALTNEKGKTRSERASDVYYSDMLSVEYAPYVKMCDRIANMEYSRYYTHDMFDKYLNELEGFLSKFETVEDLPYMKTPIKFLRNYL